MCTCPTMMWENARNFLCKVTKKDPNDHSSTTLRFEILISKQRGASLSTRNNKPIQSSFAKSDRWHMFKQNNCSKHKFLNWDDPLPPSMQWLSRLFVGNIQKHECCHPGRTHACILRAWGSPSKSINRCVAFLRNLMSCKWTFSKRVKRTRKPEYQAVNRHRWRDVKHRSTASICIMDPIIPSTMIRRFTAFSCAKTSLVMPRILHVFFNKSTNPKMTQASQTNTSSDIIPPCPHWLHHLNVGS